MAEVFNRAWDVLMVAAGLCCVWVGSQAVLRSRQPLMLHGRPVWVVRAWGLGYVLLGISLTIEPVTVMAGGEPGRPADVMRWVAGPLVVGSILAAFLPRRWERGRARAMNEGRQA
ncbi:hypothetical protein [Streptomyces sp. NPDC058451]|uniref:hypothetical protein n=1 Tax=Streptomyces sp. NPDC058451 TaxID=3346506 RepID=UPI003646A1B1